MRHLCRFLFFYRNYMAITKQKKVELAKEFFDKTKDAQSLVFVQFKKLTVKETQALRRALRAEGVGYTVIKKTLMKRVLSERGVAGEQPVLEGEVAIAFGADSIAPARSVYAFAKDHKEKVAIVGGVFEEKYMDASAMLAIATIPPLPVLYGQFVGMVQAPVRSFVSVLAQIAEKKGATA
jgi:large subunit ribosomal protein L10